MTPKQQRARKRKRRGGLFGDPPDAIWLPLYRREAGRSPTPTGEVLLSVELVTKSMARDLPVGTGRAEPNRFPELEEPMGRPSVSWIDMVNPVYWAKVAVAYLLSPLVFMCAFVIVLVAASPYLQSVFTLINMLTLSVDGVVYPLGWMGLKAVPTWAMIDMWRTTVLRGDHDDDNDGDDDDDDDDDEAAAREKRNVHEEKVDNDPHGFRLAWRLGPPLLAIYQVAWREFLLARVLSTKGSCPYVC